MIESKETLRGNINVSSSISGVVKNGVEYIEPLTQEKSIVPNIEEQVVVPDDGFSGLSKVIIEPVPLQTKESVPNEEEQTIKADDEFIGLKEVMIKAIPSEYKKPTGTKDITVNGNYDISEYEAVAVNVPSAEPRLDSRIVTPNKNIQEIVPGENYDGLSKVTVNSIPDSYIQPSGTLKITTNGTHNVTNYASVVTDVHDGEPVPIPYAPKHISFQGFTKYDLNYEVQNIDTVNITDMTNMFYNCNRITSLDLRNFNTSNVTNMSKMFSTCSKLQNVDVSSFDTSKVTDMSNMFNGCKSLTSLNVNNFDTSNVINMNYMFYNCSSLTSLNLKNFNTSNVTNMNGMFFSSYLTELDLSSFDTSNVTNMGSMFYQCSRLQKLDIRNFTFTKVTSSYSMFESFNKNCEIIVKDDTAKAWILKQKSDLTNVKTVAELGE